MARVDVCCSGSEICFRFGCLSGLAVGVLDMWPFDAFCLPGDRDVLRPVLLLYLFLTLRCFFEMWPWPFFKGNEVKT